MKRKSNEQSKKFQENIPEMELIDEEERSYICENIVSFTTGRNVFLWFIILLNLWVTIGYGWKAINMAIFGTADAFSSNLCYTSIFGGIAYSANLLRKAWFRERERNEMGVLKKRIVEVKEYEHPGACLLYTSRDCTYGEKQEEKMKNLLPLGSVVRLNKGELKIMIISRLPLYNNEGTIGYFDYAACVYPTCLLYTSFSSNTIWTFVTPFFVTSKESSVSLMIFFVLPSNPSMTSS